MDSLIKELNDLLGKADLTRLVADTHHTQDYCGRTHGFLRSEGELVPVGAIVLGVEGMPQDQGRARLSLIVAAINALPTLITELERQRAALEEIASPIAAMQRRADANGDKIDGHMATQIANSPAYLQGIAAKALEPQNG